ncbi:hypothetical protein TrVE_jg13176 [Triparma verrucosa]|uniref:HMG box domain-containing protein n=1 Tax=Triparma verrucosa TaxID=1606542 RepID=A0A9W7BJE5_9STRA|nr:hypothetical protein TrVE_jg13176 [Triparma verrucosa]
MQKQASKTSICSGRVSDPTFEATPLPNAFAMSTPLPPDAPYKYPVMLNRRHTNHVCYSTPGPHVENLVATTPSFQANRVGRSPGCKGGKSVERRRSTSADAFMSSPTRSIDDAIPFSPIFNKDGSMRPTGTLTGGWQSPIRRDRGVKSGEVVKRRRSSSMSRLGTSSGENSGNSGSSRTLNSNLSSDGELLDQTSSIGSFPLSLHSQRSSKSLGGFGEIPTYDELFNHKRLPEKPLQRSKGGRDVFAVPLSSQPPPPLQSEPAVAAVEPFRMTKPQRPLSAYNFYFKKERERMANQKKKENRGREGGAKVGFAQMGKMIGKSWKLITSTDKAPLVKLAAEDKQRYDSEMAAWKSLAQPPGTAKKLKVSAPATAAPISSPPTFPVDDDGLRRVCSDSCNEVQMSHLNIGYKKS